jgi:hypothetical protein
MLRWLAILAVIFTVAQAPVPTSGKAPDSRTHSDHTPQANGDGSDKPAPPILPVIPKDSDSQNLKTHSGKNHPPNNQTLIAVTEIPPTAWRKREWATFWASLALAIVGIGGVAIGVCTLIFISRQTGEMRLQRIAMRNTLKAIKKQANLMDRQIQIQVAGMRQWVEAANWDVKSPMITPNAVETPLSITCDIGNPTKLLLTLRAIRIIAEPIWSKEATQSASMGLLYVLAPDNPYPIQIELPIRGEHFREYSRRKLRLVITLEVEFEDAFGIWRKQNLGVTCTCGTVQWSEFTVYQNTHAIEISNQDQS